ncbi:T9SS type A sorting domain-containing protein [bacterium]|nr:T9SS type A sorting domain-containing protein [bacterium]
MDTTLSAGVTGLNAVAVDPVAGLAYATSWSYACVMVIHTDNDSVETVATGTGACAVAVNPVTGKAYVANYGSGTVTVIENGNVVDTTLSTGANPNFVSVDPVANRIFVTCWGGSIWAIDGATNSIMEVASGVNPVAVAADPVSGMAYAADYNGGAVIGIEPARFHDTGVRAVMDPAVSHFTGLSQPTLIGHAVNRWSPNRTGIMGVVNDALPCASSWCWGGGPYDSTATDSVGFFFNWGDSLVWGENLATFTPLEMMAATTNNLGLGTPFAGNRLVFPVYRVDEAAYGVAWRPTELPAPRTPVVQLRQNRPNPFSRSTAIEYQLAAPGRVVLAVYNVAGQRVATLVDAVQGAGEHSASWNGRDGAGWAAAAGVYYVRLKTAQAGAAGRMVLIR